MSRPSRSQSTLNPSKNRSASRSTPLPRSDFPNPVAVFNDRFIFTTLGRTDVERHEKVPYGHPKTGKSCVLFTLDDQLAYTPFALDHGPFNIAYTLRACQEIHDWLDLDMSRLDILTLQAKKYRDRPFCMYTSNEPQIKSNMLLMAAIYFLLVGGDEPWAAYRPVAHFEVIPFRDAGNGLNEWGLCIQDCLYGMHKAIHNSLLDLTTFDAVSYEYYESPRNGDMNILGPFIPFASPTEQAFIKATRSTRSRTSSGSSEVEGSPIFGGTLSFPKAKTLSHGFRCVMKVFEEEQVGVVIRLNDELYDRRHFLDAGIEHVEMYFDDGSNPSDPTVREFIRIAEDFIENRGKKVAVHCKAGLGRTGCLIGAYFIYKYHFSAQEVIGYMRMVRPGMVVGAQQHYMIANQMKWVTWGARDQLLKDLAAEKQKEMSNPLATPPMEEVSILPSLSLPGPFAAASVGIALADAIERFEVQGTASTSVTAFSPIQSPKRGDAVGQPRKTPKPLKTDYIDVTTPEPESMADIEMIERQPSPTPAQTPLLKNAAPFNESLSRADTPNLGSMRGTKRGGTRLPLPSSPSHPPPTISAVSNLDIGILPQRTPSLLSVASQNERPTKRRVNFSSPAQSGQPSSPPPSRDVTPEKQDEPMAIDVLASGKIPGKLRRRAIPAPTAVVRTTVAAAASVGPLGNLAPLHRFAAQPISRILPAHTQTCSKRGAQGASTSLFKSVRSHVVDASIERNKLGECYSTRYE